MAHKKLLERKQKDEEDTAFAFQEFLEAFQNSTPMSKTFIQSGVYVAGGANKVRVETQGKIYAPVPIYRCGDVTQKALECARLVKEEKLKSTSKSKSNIQELKEELEQRHHQVEKTLKILATSSISVSPVTVALLPQTTRSIKEINLGLAENTTNLYISNLDESLSEQDLMQIFGVFGPLASVKVMWPRIIDRSKPCTHIGFVAFMSRQDCRRAYYALSRRTDMKIAWGKPVEIPLHPVYIPPELAKKLAPPPPSGLPFNAQVPNSSNARYTPKDLKAVNLPESYVRVTIPLDRKVLFAVHRTIEFVIRGGPLIEAMIMQREYNNSLYDFLFDNQSPVHTYYRWKLFSVLHGEPLNDWSGKPFRMFQGGSIWLPPVVHDYTKGMDVKMSDIEAVMQGKRLLDSEYDTLIKLIQRLTPKNSDVRAAMLFCISRMPAAYDIVNIIVESFETPLGEGKKIDKDRGVKQIARLYLISDILYNARIQQFHNLFHKLFKEKIVHIFKAISLTLKQYNKQNEKHYSTMLTKKVMNVLSVWLVWKTFSYELLQQLEIVIDESEEANVDGDKQQEAEQFSVASTYKIDNKVEIIIKIDQEEPRQTEVVTETQVNIVPSKWETQSPEVVKNQAMSTARLHEMEFDRKYAEELKKRENVADSDKIVRLRVEDLRKVEMKVIKYQDKLDSRKRKFRYANNMHDELDEYRKKCIKRMKVKMLEKELLDTLC